MKEISKIINDLIKKLNNWNYSYYHDNKSLVSDQIYDATLHELKKLEEKYPEYALSNSPTKRVGGFVSDKFEKYTHKEKMLSLDNAFNLDDLFKFQDRVKIEKFNKIYSVEPKIDGISISIIYKKGKLIFGVTRGDGEVGENITNNIFMIDSIPKVIDDKNEYLEIRGEAYLDKENFIRINKDREEEGLEPYANSRNLTSGTLRQLDSLVVASRKLSFFAYEIISNIKFNNQEDKLSYLKKIGFNVNDLNSTQVGIENVYNKIKEIENRRNELNYDIDGVVIKVNEITAQKIMGHTTKFPKWAIAYKLSEEKVTTKLEDIFMTIGRTGRINYNAKLTPVKLMGTTVQRATLHNSDYIEQLDIRIGDDVYIKKAGDIIPKVLGVSKKANNSIKWISPKECISCKKPLVKYKGEVDQYCTNENCKAKIIEKLNYFVSKNAMDINNISIKIIENFYNNSIIKNYVDIYTLSTKKNEILNLDGFKDKSYQNIIDSVNQSKANSLERLITGLGIKHIGSQAAKLIAEEIGELKLDNIGSIINFKIRGIGEKIEYSWKEFFLNKKNIELLKKLKSEGVNFKYKGSKKLSTIFKNKSIVITGTLSKPRQYYTDLIVNNSGKVTSVISSNTDYLLCGEKSGSKLNKARKLGIEIIDENGLLNLLNLK